jgi:hypothetical protein
VIAQHQWHICRTACLGEAMVKDAGTSAGTTTSKQHTQCRSAPTTTPCPAAPWHGRSHGIQAHDQGQSQAQQTRQTRAPAPARPSLQALARWAPVGGVHASTLGCNVNAYWHANTHIPSATCSVCQSHACVAHITSMHYIRLVHHMQPHTLHTSPHDTQPIRSEMVDMHYL